MRSVVRFVPRSVRTQGRGAMSAWLAAAAAKIHTASVKCPGCSRSIRLYQMAGVFRRASEWLALVEYARLGRRDSYPSAEWRARASEGLFAPERAQYPALWPVK